jgi:hypothetical protein
MEDIDLGTMIVGVICGIGIIQFVMWVVVVMLHPGLDDVTIGPDPDPNRLHPAGRR